jgi:hypothetical protein
MKFVSIALLLGWPGVGDTGCTPTSVTVAALSRCLSDPHTDLFCSHRRPVSRPRRLRGYLADDDSDDTPSARPVTTFQGHASCPPIVRPVLRAGNVCGPVCPGIPPPLIYAFCTLLI